MRYIVTKQIESTKLEIDGSLHKYSLTERHSDHRNYSNIPDDIRLFRYINAQIIMVTVGNKHGKVYYIEF